jgi:predicted TPR repeat methyltransferase
VIRNLLQRALDEEGVDPRNLRFLDLGAGNGLIAEQLREMGVSKQVGIDIVESAKMAAERDRPSLYDEYFIVDMTAPPAEVHDRLRSYEFNGMICVAALGFGDIPTDAFVTAYNLVSPGGWVAFNIKEEFLDDRDSTGFSRLVHSMMDEGAIEIRAQERYRHRLATNGEGLNYVAFVGKKQRDLRF